MPWGWRRAETRETTKGQKFDFCVFTSLLRGKEQTMFVVQTKGGQLLYFDLKTLENRCTMQDMK
jgi:hypothetical protein